MISFVFITDTLRDCSNEKYVYILIHDIQLAIFG